MHFLSACLFFTVFGWLNGRDITLEERTSTYTLPAGFIKGGAVQSFVTSQSFARFRIAIEEGNARKWSYQTKREFYSNSLCCSQDMFHIKPSS